MKLSRALLRKSTALLVASAGMLALPSPSHGQAPRVAGPLAVEPVNAPPVTLEQLRGSVVGVLLLNIPNCSECDDAVRTIGPIRDELHERGLEVLGLAVDPGGQPSFDADLRSWVAGLDPSVPVAGVELFTELQGFTGESSIPAWPTLMVIDRDGVIQEEHPYTAFRGVVSGFWSDPEGNLRAAFNRWLAAGTGSAPPMLPASSIVDAASFTPPNESGGAPSPGSIVSIFGSGFADSLVIAEATPLPTSLGGVSVTIDGRPLPLFFVSGTQINAQLPYRLVEAGARGGVLVTVQNDRGTSGSQLLTVAGTSPSLYTFDQTGGGQAIAVFANSGALVAPTGLTADSRPAKPGEAITLFANGLGDVSPAIAPGVNSCDPDGVCAPDFSNLTLRYAVVEPTLEIGGALVPRENLIFAGLAPQFVGLFQINFILPEDVPGGPAVPVVLRQLAASSRLDVTIAIQHDPAPPVAVDGDAENGRTLFLAKCAVCHNADSRDKKIGPGLRGIGDGLLPSGLPATVENIREQINEGGNGMPTFRNLLTEEEKDDLIAYLLTL